MPDEDDEEIKAAVEVFKVAYEDAFQPLAKQVGKAGGTLGKAVNIALDPARAVIWGYDEIKGFVTSKVTGKLENRQVKPEDIVTPDPDIAVPSIEALRYTKLKEEFANLLASAMDKNNSGEIHPSFVDILKQMSPDEAKILRYLSSQLGPFPFAVLRHYTDVKRGKFKPLDDYYGTVATDANCNFPVNLNTYMTNLFRLRLLEKVDVIRLSDENEYRQLFSAHDHGKYYLDNSNKKFHYEKRVYRLSALGKIFLKHCLE